MDPNACLERLLTAIEKDDWDNTRDAYIDLRDWVRGGGFEPTKFSEEPALRKAFFESCTATMAHVRGIVFRGI